MINSLQFLFGVYLVCIGLSIAALITTLFFVIPLQVKKVNVQNGLRSLRQKLLMKGVLAVIMNSSAIIVLTSRFYLEGDIVRYLNTGLVFVFCLCLFLKQLIESSIYHTQFTEEQIQIHHKIYKEELRRGKKHETDRVKLNSDRRKATKARQNLTNAT